MTRVLVACDKFKGSLSSDEVAHAVSKGILDALPKAQVIDIRVGDGGDGTLEAVLSAGFERIPVTVSGPTGEPVESAFAIRHHEVFIELADLCGLLRMPDGQLAPLSSSSRGLGEAIAQALHLQPDRIVIGVGGSASTDGGAGMLVALGARLLDAAGHEIANGGAGLVDVASVDLTGIDARVRETEFVLASDVSNPLVGPDGAAAVFGPQKGATASDIKILERGLSRFADLLTRSNGRDDRWLPGAGAAGGVGYAAQAVLNAGVRPGIEIVLDIAGFADATTGADLVITGEGRLDRQTMMGKTPAGVANAARGAGIPVVAVCGINELSRGELSEMGIDSVVSLHDLEPDMETSMRRAGPLLQAASSQLIRRTLELGA